VINRFTQVKGFFIFFCASWCYKIFGITVLQPRKHSDFVFKNLKKYMSGNIEMNFISSNMDCLFFFWQRKINYLILKNAMQINSISLMRQGHQSKEIRLTMQDSGRDIMLQIFN
jgi:hypothetical protein